MLGSDGVHWMLDASEGLPLTVYVMAPSCVPASGFESPRRALLPGDLEGLLRRVDRCRHDVDLDQRAGHQQTVRARPDRGPRGDGRRCDGPRRPR